MADISHPPDSALLDIYDQLKDQSRNTTPDFTKIFISNSTKFPELFGKIVVLFDAFDECDPSHQATIRKLIGTFNSSGISTYITTRSHNISYVPENLPKDTKLLPIAAREEDIKNYIREELKRREITINTDHEAAIIERISEGAGGM
jgi:hypothetical protein